MPTDPQHYAEPIERLIAHYETLQRFTGYYTTLFHESSRRSGSQHPMLTDPFYSLIHAGPAKHWKTYRQHLLELHTKPFDYRKYVGAYLEEVDPAYGCRNYEETRIAGWVASWTQHSRRVYSVPGDLQLLLAATTLDNVDWSTIRWPFDSFLVKLEHPLSVGEQTYDAILVAQDKETWPGIPGKTKTIILISTTMYTQSSVFNQHKVADIEKDIARGKLDRAADRLQTLARNRMAGEHLLRIIRLPEDSFVEHPPTEAALAAYTQTTSRSVIRILFGLLFYLQTAPATETCPRGWEPASPSRRDGVTKKITDAAEVCRIASVYTLDDAERTVFQSLLRGGVVDVAPHHREGHWRRPPGQGHDPTAKKTVWVRPTIVRRDRLADGGLPGGSEERM